MRGVTKIVKVLILTDTLYPSSNAVSVRIQFIAKLIKRAGNEVKVYSRSKLKSGIHDEIEFVSLRGKYKSKFGLAWIYFVKMPSIFSKKIREEKPDVIMVYNTTIFMFLMLLRLQKKEEFTLVKECLEWYSKEESTPFSFERIRYYVSDLKNRFITPKISYLTVISRYFQNYFSKNGNSCCYLPAMCDVNKIKFTKKTEENKIIILYAGSPQKKDIFDTIIRSMQSLNKEQKDKMVLRIIGATKQEIATNANVTVNNIDELGDCIEFLPRMPHDKIFEQLQKADFTILIRPHDLRYAKAGFPTKVPESLVTGTPIICNLTSDLKDFLTDGYDSIIARDESVDSVKRALERAIELSKEERNMMYENARHTAEEKFDYRLFETSVEEFFDNINRACKRRKNG